MADDTLNLLNDCQLTVSKPNPRQYIADIPSLPGLEVWFQRASDVVRKIRTGDVDLGIVGYDAVCEYGQLGKKFVEENGLKFAQLLTADGALEAAPAMGTADAILDLVSSGTTLRENNLKEIEGGLVLKSQGVLVASKKALLQRETALEKTREILERLEAHLRVQNQFIIVANMRGKSAHHVAELIIKETDFHGRQGPTINPVFCGYNGKVQTDYYAIVICVQKNHLYDAVKQLRKE